MKKILYFISTILTLSMNAQKQGTYSNPILAGFYPDPSICRVGSDYYLVTSSFSYYPGLPIFHSKDLVSWQQLGHAMDRPEQLELKGAGVSRGLFAPTIRYYKGLFYIVCTLIDKGGNFVITAKNPKGPWSKPAWLKNVDGIDPSLYFDESADKAWIIYNSIPPDNKSLYNGHRTIRMRSFDYKSLKAADKETLLVNGGTDITKNPVWIEAPHIYKVNDWYYLLCAEGGTGYNHSEVVFRSKNVEGPYESFSGNPILTQRHLDPNRKNPITTTGHADLVQTNDGKWYAVFLGCRPYEGDYYNTGRETFLAPVHWENEWPIITKGDEAVSYNYPLPFSKTKASKKEKLNPGIPFNGNFKFSTIFSNIDPRFVFLRTVTEKWYNTSGLKGSLGMKLRPETISGTGNPSFIGFRQSHLKCTASTLINFNANSENEKAGLVIFQNEHHFYYFCISKENGKKCIQLYQSTTSDSMELVTSQPVNSPTEAVGLRIESDGSSYSFYWTEGFQYSSDLLKWKLFKSGLDGKFLSTKTAGGFVGSTFGMYATSQGQPSNNNSTFYWFEYQGKDDVYQ